MAIESLIENPFAGFGKPVCGKHFVGREYALMKIKNRVLCDNPGNLSIVGLPRIGKSSLVLHGILNGAKELSKKKKIPINFYVGTITCSYSFFVQMCENTYEALEIESIEEEHLKKLNAWLESLQSKYEQSLVKKFFKYIKKIVGYSIIFVFDEFDRVQSFFGMEDYQFLRAMSDDKDIDLIYVICSRKTIYDIQTKDDLVSNFANIFDTLNLGMFSDDDMKAYWQRSREMKWEVPADVQTLIKFHVGEHPWLLDQVNDLFFELSGEKDKFKTHNFQLTLMHALDNMITTLEHDSLLNPAIQLVIGPYDHVSPKDVEKLLRYGFLKQVDPEEKKKIFGGMQIGPVVDGLSFVCFSEYSTLDLYRRYHANVPYHSLWNETENMMRSLVKVYLSTKYKVNWETEMKNFVANNPGPNNKRYDVTIWDKKLSDLKTNRESIVKHFPVMSGGDLIDFTTTTQLFDLFIRRDNWFFNNIFKGTYTDWNNKFEKISHVRNVVQHNNSTSDISLDINLAREYCEEIKQVITKWNQKNNPTT